ncbi:MAG: haloacid dehalogenase-like hydrolase [Anaerolineaceae bacterium]
MIVISDMMGTLTTGSPILGIVDWVRHNQSRSQARWRMAAIMPGYLLMKGGLIDQQTWGQKLMIQSLGWVHDATPEKFDQVSEWVVEHNLWQKRREDVISRLIEHTRGGAQVYIASSVVEPIACAFARRFGVEAIGSQVTIENGRVRLAKNLLSSERKINEVLSRLKVTRIGYAYGDTAMDIPLLEAADHPVAVYPDRRLYSVALERGWQILGEPQ